MRSIVTGLVSRQEGDMSQESKEAGAVHAEHTWEYLHAQCIREIYTLNPTAFSPARRRVR